MKENIYDRIPYSSIGLIQEWISLLSLEIILTSPRTTKLGDFKISKNRKHLITINNNLNPYLSLITLTHEIAHAFVWKEYGSSVSPHAKEWKTMFKRLMLNFLNDKVFPEKILKVLSNHLINPKASTTTDIVLYKCLQDFDNKKIITISDIEEGEVFLLRNGKKLIKGEKLRKRFKCQEYTSKKIYSVHPLAEVVRM